MDSNSYKESKRGIRYLYRLIADCEWHLMSDVLQSMPKTINIHSRPFADILRSSERRGHLSFKLSFDSHLVDSRRRLYIKKN